LTQKGPDAFRTISEAAIEVGVPAHVLRFWETKFKFITPMRRPGGRRLYRPADVLILSAVRRMLHDEVYTISDLQRLSAKAVLEHVTDCRVVATPREGAAQGPDGQGALKSALARAMAAKARLDSLLAQSTS
jgi:DNA-binding transcriptional MerR regulator